MKTESTTRRNVLETLFAGAAVATPSVPPKPSSSDVIRQRELRAYLMAHNAHSELMLSFRRRLEAGASIEPGPFKFTSEGAVTPEEETAVYSVGLDDMGCSIDYEPTADED